MKKCLFIFGLLVSACLLQAETEFLKSLAPEDAANAGLQKLSPAELARLEGLVQRYKSGELEQARQQADAKAAASRQEADKKIVAAELKAKQAESKAQEAAMKNNAAATSAQTGPTKKQPGWFTALITLNRASQKPGKEEPLESRLVGDFNGWNGRSIFNLENGTRWIQQNKSESYAYSPVLHSPKVKITPASITGFWLEIEGVNLSVRVTPLQLEQK